MNEEDLTDFKVRRANTFAVEPRRSYEPGQVAIAWTGNGYQWLETNMGREAPWWVRQAANLGQESVRFRRAPQRLLM